MYDPVYYVGYPMFFKTTGSTFNIFIFYIVIYDYCIY